MLHDPLLSVRHSEVALVPPRLDQITPPDAEAVAAGRRHRVVNLSRLDAPIADALVQRCRLIVRGDGDRLAVAGMGGDVLADRIVVGMHHDEAQSGELVEHVTGVLAVAHPQSEGGVVGVGEAVQLGHVVGTATNLRGHVEHPATTDSRELGAVAHERDRRLRLLSDGQEGAGGVLVEHPGLVHDHPLTPQQSRVSRRPGVGAPAIGVGVARREACP